MSSADKVNNTSNVSKIKRSDNINANTSVSNKDRLKNKDVQNSNEPELQQSPSQYSKQQLDSDKSQVHNYSKSDLDEDSFNNINQTLGYIDEIMQHPLNKQPDSENVQHNNIDNNLSNVQTRNRAYHDPSDNNIDQPEGLGNFEIDIQQQPGATEVKNREVFDDIQNLKDKDVTKTITGFVKKTTTITPNIWEENSNVKVVKNDLRKLTPEQKELINGASELFNKINNLDKDDPLKMSINKGDLTLLQRGCQNFDHNAIRAALYNINKSNQVPVE